MAIIVTDYMTLAMELSDGPKKIEDQMDKFFKDRLNELDEGWELQTLIPFPGGHPNVILTIWCKRTERA
jgi:hypothetical protein